jgi:hypothetical protein
MIMLEIWTAHLGTIRLYVIDLERGHQDDTRVKPYNDVFRSHWCQKRVALFVYILLYYPFSNPDVQ